MTSKTKSKITLFTGITAILMDGLTIPVKR